MMDTRTEGGWLGGRGQCWRAGEGGGVVQVSSGEEGKYTSEKEKKTYINCPLHKRQNNNRKKN